MSKAECVQVSPVDRLVIAVPRCLLGLEDGGFKLSGGSVFVKAYSLEVVRQCCGILQTA